MTKSKPSIESGNDNFMVELVDSSLWVHQLRHRGDPEKRERVEQLLRCGLAAWCAPVRLELWRGVSNDRERRALRDYEAILPEYAITNEVWELAIQNADRGRANGLSFPLADLLIFACSKIHRLKLAHADKHFEQMMSL